MKIKYRITLLFTLVVTIILLIVCTSVYYLTNLNREKDFRKRLHNRALTTISLLTKVEGIDKDLMSKIDANMFFTIQEKSVIVYDEHDHEIYRHVDSTVDAETANGALLARVRTEGEYVYTDHRRTIVAIPYTRNHKSYVVLSSAFDLDGYAKLAQLKFILTLSFITGILATIVCGLLFSARLVVPIKKITNEVKEISSQNLSRRIDTIYEPKDELYELSSTFNDLLTRLQESFEIQRRFIANASHELSTPLTSISSQLEITLQNQRSAEEYRSVISSVYDDVKQLNQLTRSLLELAKASGSTDGMELSLVRIDELLMKLPSELRKTNKDYTVELHFNSFPDDEDKLLVFGNSDLLYSAIKNIALNACKYSEDHFAAVVLNFVSDELQVLISDNGPGISELDKQLVFQPFYRAKSTSQSQGFGLGLSLASRIIQLHKGRIAIESGSPRGTRFIINFPVARAFHRLQS